MKRHALIACLVLPLSCAGSHAPTAAPVLDPPAIAVEIAPVILAEPATRTKRAPAQPVHSARRANVRERLAERWATALHRGTWTDCFAAHTWRPFRWYPHDIFGFLMSRVESDRVTRWRGSGGAGDLLREDALAVYAIERLVSDIDGKPLDAVEILIRPERRFGTRHEALRRRLGDPHVKAELKKRLFDLYAAVANLRPDFYRELARDIFPQGDGK